MSRLYRRPSESSGADGQIKTTTDEGAEAKPEQEGTDLSAQLQAELSAAKSEAEHWRDRFLRKAAEFENYRKRVEREKSESVMLAKSSVLGELLPVVDACERALGSFSSTEDAGGCLDQYREGFQLMYRQLAETLARLGVLPIAALGEKFDPNLHEALSREETLEYDENTVIEELRTGYMYRDRLLRPAQVKVAIRPQTPLRQPAGEKDV